MKTKNPNVRIAIFCAIFPALGLAACGTEIHDKYDAPPAPPRSPDAAVVYVYVTPDAAPAKPCACTCVCAENGVCGCNCDCGPTTIVTTSSPQTDAAPTLPDAPLAKNDAMPDPVPGKDATLPGLGDAKPELLPAAEAPAAINDARPNDPIIEPPPADAAAGKNDAAADTPPDMPDAFACKTQVCACMPPAGTDAGKDPLSLIGTNRKLAYTPFSSTDYVTSQNGFGIYSPNSPTGDMRLTVGLNVGLPPAYDISVNYDFTPYKMFSGICNCDYLFYNWFSLRSEFLETQNLCGTNGIAFEVSGNIASPRPEAALRFTVSDLANSSVDAGASTDELWWYDIPQSKVTADWLRIEIPWTAFYLPGTRINDRKLDPTQIAAFEIAYQYNVSIDCTYGCTEQLIRGSGHFDIRNLTTY